MSRVLLASLLVLSLITDTPAQSSPAASHATSELRVRAKSETTIYWSPTAVRPRRAIVEEGAIVRLAGTQRKSGRGCRGDWAPVQGGGYLCLDTVEATREQPFAVPPLIDGFLPFVYVHVLDTIAYSYAFLPGEGADHVRLYRRGKLLDESRYIRHTPSRFQGWNLKRHPVASRNLVPGWTVADKVPVYPAPSTAKGPIMHLARHQALLVSRRPAARGWREVRDAKGRRALGYMKDDDSLRYWVSADPVKGLSKGETWLDIDVGQQMIAVRSFGSGPVYVTLVSTGLEDRPSPLGVFRLQYKLAYRSMGNFPKSADKYFIEDIPWVMYFLPEYAIHGAYWHDDFGKRRSHGCINLAPRDAHYIYDHVPPMQQPGFFKTFASDEAPGAVVRLRDSAKLSSSGESAPHGRSES